MSNRSIPENGRGVNRRPSDLLSALDPVTLYHLARFHAGLPADTDLLRQALSPHGLEEMTEGAVVALLREHPRVAEAVARIDPEGESPRVPPVRIDEDLPAIPVDDVLHYYENEQDGDAMLLVRLFRGRIVYDPATDVWYIWDGNHWVPDRTDFMQRLLSGPVASVYLEAASRLNQEAEAASHAGNKARAQALAHQSECLIRRAKQLKRRRWARDVMFMARSWVPSEPYPGEGGVGYTRWDANPWLLGVANGVINLRTGRFRPGAPADMVRTVAPIPWRGMQAPRPLWEKFLLDIMGGRRDLVAFLQRLIGYGITGETTEHVLPIFWGMGRNGKDTFLEVLSHVLGPLAGPINAEALIDTGAFRRPGSPTPHLMSLQGKRIVWANETSEGARLNAATVKWLTGGGSIVARPPYGRAEIQFRPSHLLILITNHRPHADPDDYALWKRLLLLPFTEVFVDDPDPRDPRQHKRDPYLLQKLRGEAPGILAWMVEGCLHYQDEGLNPPPEVSLATQEYRQDEDTLGQFLEECCLVGPEFQARAGALYQAYREWAERNGFSPMSSHAFGRRMKKRFLRERSRSGYVYVGVGLPAGDGEGS